MNKSLDIPSNALKCSKKNYHTSNILEIFVVRYSNDRPIVEAYFDRSADNDRAELSPIL